MNEQGFEKLIEQALQSDIKADKSDMLETIEQCEQYLLTHQKHETSFLKNGFELIRYGLWKSVLIQSCICFVLLVGMMVSITDVDDFDKIPVLVGVMAIFCFVSFVYEALDNLRFNTYEMEMVCYHSPSKVLAFKMEVVAIYTGLLLAIVALILQQRYSISFWFLFSYGILPFLLLDSFVLIVYKRCHNFTSLMEYSICFIVLLAFIHVQLKDILYQLDTHIYQIVIVLVMALFIIELFYQKQRVGDVQ